jgi:hypothetical protein
MSSAREFNKFMSGAALAALFLSSPSHAYLESTHEILTQRAFQLSDVYTTLANPSPLVQVNLFPITYKKAMYAMRAGARYEDSGLRPLAHFYNPINDQSLSPCSLRRTCAASPDWAIDGGTVSDPQSAPVLSYRSAVARYYDALTLRNRSDRHAAAYDMFFSLGSVVHHLQDMAQPQHVRNDPHCGWHCLWKYAASYYEDFADSKSPAFAKLGSAATYRFSATAPSAFQKPRDFWKNASTETPGMAVITNRTFVSYRTNFSECASGPFCAAPDFPNPSPRDAQLVTSATRILDDARVLYETLVEFPAGSQQYISTANELVNDGVSYRYFSLTDVNYQAQADKLVPLAIEHSAGLINYFFRGKIQGFSRSPTTPMTIFVLGADLGAGKFEIYADAADGTRSRLTQWSLSTPGARSGTSISTGLVLPPGYYTLVFRPEKLCKLNEPCFDGDESDMVVGGLAIVNSIPG